MYIKKRDGSVYYDLDKMENLVIQGDTLVIPDDVVKLNFSFRIRFRQK